MELKEVHLIVRERCHFVVRVADTSHVESESFGQTIFCESDW
jgi:hypothetical protein